MRRQERSYVRQPDVGDLGEARAEPPVEWEYVPTRRRPGAPDGSLPVRVLLIDEGARLVDRRGPSALSVAECARRVGVSKGAPYVWFADAADFRLAVAANLTSALVAELTSGGSGSGSGGGRGSYPDPNPDPVAMLTRDVGAVVRNWIGNGMGLELIFVAGGPASRTELAWEAERLLGHLRSRVHHAAACACAATDGLCFGQRDTVHAVLALCQGFAALARTIDQDPELLARAAEQTVSRLLSATG